MQMGIDQGFCFGSVYNDFGYDEEVGDYLSNVNKLYHKYTNN